MAKREFNSDYYDSPGMKRTYTWLQIGKLFLLPALLFGLFYFSLRNVSVGGYKAYHFGVIDEFAFTLVVCYLIFLISILDGELKIPFRIMKDRAFEFFDDLRFGNFGDGIRNLFANFFNNGAIFELYLLWLAAVIVCSCFTFGRVIENYAAFL